MPSEVHVSNEQGWKEGGKGPRRVANIVANTCREACCDRGWGWMSACRWIELKMDHGHAARSATTRGANPFRSHHSVAGRDEIQHHQVPAWLTGRFRCWSSHPPPHGHGGFRCKGFPQALTLAEPPNTASKHGLPIHKDRNSKANASRVW